MCGHSICLPNFVAATIGMIEFVIGEKPSREKVIYMWDKSPSKVGTITVDGNGGQ